MGFGETDKECQIHELVRIVLLYNYVFLNLNLERRRRVHLKIDSCFFFFFFFFVASFQKKKEEEKKKKKKKTDPAERLYGVWCIFIF